MSVQDNIEELKIDVKTHEGAKPTSLPRQSENTVNDESLYYLPGGEFFHVFLWCGMLLLAFGLGRLLCVGHGNYENCRTQLESNVFDNLSSLLLMGIALCFFTGIHSAIRFNYLYGFGAETNYSGFLFLFTFVLTPVAWKGLDTTALKSFMFSREGLSNNIVPLLISAFLFFFSVGWHFYTAYRLGVFKIYLISRCLVFVYFILNIVVCLNEPDIEIHVHHYQLGWFVGFLACFNHPISVVTLAFGAGLFVEGLAIFGADSMFVPVSWNSTVTALP